MRLSADGCSTAPGGRGPGSLESHTRRPAPSIAAWPDESGCYVATAPGGTDEKSLTEPSAPPRPVRTGVKTKPDLTRAGEETRPRGQKRPRPAGGVPLEGDGAAGPSCKLCGALAMYANGTCWDFINQICYDCIMRDDWRVTADGRIVRGT